MPPLLVHKSRDPLVPSCPYLLTLLQFRQLDSCSLSLTIVIYNNLTKTLKWDNYEKKYGKKISNGVWSQESGKKISNNGIIAQDIAPSEKGRIMFVQSDILRGISGTISYNIDNDDEDNDKKKDKDKEVDKDKDKHDKSDKQNMQNNEELQEFERKSKFHSVTISKEEEDDKSNEDDKRDKRDASEENDGEGRR